MFLLLLLLKSSHLYHIKKNIKGDLHKRVIVEDSYWTLEDSDDQQYLTIYLQKSNTMEWWKSVIQGHPEIDTSKVEPENSNLSDLDGDTRQTVEKMMVNCF